MKSRLIVLLVLSLLILNVGSVLSQDLPAGVAGGDVFGGKLGEVDPDTGLPERFSDFKDTADNFREQDKEYLKREWTKVLANNKYIGPTLFYTHKYISVLNPLWELLFGIPFSWSFAFMLSVVMWIFLMVVIYGPINGMKYVSVLVSVVGASIISYFAMESFINGVSSLIPNIFVLIIVLVIVVILLVVYLQIFRDIRKKSEGDEEKDNRKKLKRDVKVAEAFSEGISK